MANVAVRQGDAATATAEQIIELLRKESSVIIENRDDYAQKMVAVVEIVKRQLAETKKKLYQYNRLTVKSEVLSEPDELQLEPRKLKYRVPHLEICLATSPQSLGSEWTFQELSN